MASDRGVGWVGGGVWKGGGRLGMVGLCGGGYRVRAAVVVERGVFRGSWGKSVFF